MDLGLKNKAAVVAASSKGLGFAIVKNLLTEGAGVVMNGRSASQLDQAAQELEAAADLRTWAGNVTIQSDCEELIDFSVREFGKLDILVTNCGGPDSGGFEDVTEEQWRQAIDRSLMSHIYLIKAALPYLKNSPVPSILTITSFTVKSPLPNLILSNAIRAATIGLTKSLANEYGPMGIRVNSILPGWTSTERVDQLMAARSQSNSSSSEEEKSRVASSIPLKRMGRPDEFGKAATFLISPAASYITGVMLSVDGGITRGLY